MENRSKVVLFGMALAELWLGPSAGALAQTLGTYVYSSGSTTGTMTVTDVSACQQKDALGCMSAVRPLKVHLRTLNNASGNDCDLDAVEETTGRTKSATELQTMLVIDDERSHGKPNLLITFAKFGALVQPQANGGEIGCGVGVSYFGRWRRKGR